MAKIRRGTQIVRSEDRWVRQISDMYVKLEKTVVSQVMYLNALYYWLRFL
jgi:hypothetical protein